MPYPKIELIEAQALTASDRGTGGFGSTDEDTEDLVDDWAVNSHGEKI